MFAGPNDSKGLAFYLAVSLFRFSQRKMAKVMVMWLIPVD